MLRAFLSCLACALIFGCGGLSTHQSAKLLDHEEKAILGGFGAGGTEGCHDDTGKVALGNRCVLTTDPFIGIRYGWHPLEADDSVRFDRTWATEMGLKISGVPFLGGTIIADFRVQPVSGPVYVSYDFGFSIFPCISSGYEDNDNKDCHDNPFAMGAYAGATAGWDWLHAGAKYWVNANTWDGWQMLPGVTVGGAWGPKRFKLMPSVDMYFYQFPFDAKLDPRIIYGLGARIGL